MSSPGITADRGPDFTPENEAADEARMFPFDGAREPMRALRDLIGACEGIFGSNDHGEQDLLHRAQEGFTSLRALFGDNRPGEEIAEAAMVEPPLQAAPDVLHPGCKKVRDVVIALLKLPMHADLQVDDGAEFRDFTIEHVVREAAPGDAQLVVIKPE